MDAELLKEFLEMIKEVSPVVWESAVKQVYVNGFTSIFWGLVLLFLFICCGLYVKALGKVAEKENRSNTESELVMGLILTFAGFLSLFVSLGNFLQAIRYFMNPNFYAIQVLLDLVK